MKILTSSPTSKKHIVLLLLLLLCCVKATWADDELSATLHVEQAGSLSSMMGTTKKNSITNLTLTGELNTADFQFIREMAGCYDRWTRQPGKLRHLDLSGARLVTSGGVILIYHTTESRWDDYLVNIDSPQEFPKLLEYLDQLQTVVLPNNITSIGDYAFDRCTNLQSIKLPSGLKSIGTAAFQLCGKLSDITLPSNLNSIGEWAFNQCTSLTTFTVPSNVTTIPERAFANCTNLASISMPSTITSIGNCAFNEDEKLAISYLPSALESMGYKAFYGCKSLTLWRLPNFVKSIGSHAFMNCTGLTQMQIPSRVTEISTCMFDGCTNLTKVTFDGKIKSIGEWAFSGCSSLSSFTVQGYDNLTSIGNYAFKNCSSLASFDLPSTTTTIGTSSFYGCAGLKNIYLPANVTTIGSSAFSGCTNLQSIFADMPSPISVPSNTFDGVDKQTCTLYVPQGKYQTYWLADVWGDFANIIDSDSGTIDEQVSVRVNTAGTLESLLGGRKWHVTNLKVWGLLNIYDIQCIRKMAGCYYNANGGKYTGNLHHLDLADAIYDSDDTALPLYTTFGQNGTFYIKNHIPYAIFSYLHGLQSVILPSNESSIGERMFNSCANLVSVYIQNSRINAIGKATFRNCNSLTTVNIPSNCQTIDKLAFCGCSSLTTVNIPSSCQTIGSEAFHRCTNLTSLTLPEGVSSIEDLAFASCSIKELTLPTTLKSIGNSAFSNCNALTTINAKMATPATVSENTFFNVPYDKCYLFVPEGSANAYKAAEVWKNFTHIAEDLAGGTTVVVDEAGTLSTKISSDDKNKITKLKVVGSINIDDIQFLREMAGCWIEEKGKSTSGVLQYLNLKDAQLVGGDKSINVYREAWWGGYKANICEAKAKIEADGKNFSNLFRQLFRLNTIVIPEYLTTTGHGTFAYSPVRKVSLSPNITMIGDSTFCYCNELASIDLPSGLTVIGKGAFAKCEKLSSVSLPSGLTSLEAGAFAGCGFTEFVVPDGITTISDGLFSGCDKLTSVTLPKGITAIGSRAFAGCGFTEFVIPEGITAISDYLFANCPNLQTVIFPNNLKSVGKGIFSGCGFSYFTLPRQITAITDEMFSNCANLGHIYLHDGLTSIGDYAFQYCNSLGGITLPASVTKIGKGCFSCCDYLKEGVTLSDAITEIPDEAFAYCGYLHEIKLPAELKRIGYRAFSGSPYIGSFGGLKLPSKVTEIAQEAFYKSFQDIEDLVLPASLKTLGDYAFAECSAKAIYSFMQEPLPLKPQDFDMRDRSQCKLYVPKGTAQKYREAEVWKEFDIEEFDASGIAGVTKGNTVKEVARYDENGHLLTAPTKGMNIVRYSDGTMKKVMVK